MQPGAACIVERPLQVSSVFALFQREIAGESAVLLVQKRDGDWTLPGGHLAAGERPLEGLRREVLEETGIWLRADCFESEPCAVLRRAWKQPTDIAAVYRVLSDGFERRLTDVDEVRQAAWFARSRPPKRLTQTAAAFWGVT